MGSNDNTEEVVLTAMKKTTETSVIRMERVKKKDIDPAFVHHIAGGPYKGILVNKMAENLNAVDQPEGRVEFMAHLVNSDFKDESLRDLWTLRFWFRGKADGVTKKNTFRDYFSELVSPGNVPRKYVGFIKRALVLLQRYTLVKRLELEVEEKDDTEDLPPINSFVSVFTPDSYTYRFVPEVGVDSKTFLTFKLKCKCDANITLCAIYGSVEHKAYEIAIGADENTRSYIRDGSLGVVKSEAETINILSEDEFRYFWVSWADNHVEVGRGARYGQQRFLSWQVPENRRFKVNSLAVATSRHSKGQWEFAEIIDEKDLKKEAKHKKIKMSLLWLAKKQRMLQTLEDAYPNNMSLANLWKSCKVKQSDTITAVVMLKDMEKKGLIKELEKGIWLRMQTKEEITDHDVQLVKEFPTLSGKEHPQIAIITSLYHEKLAVDAMISDKKTFVKYQTEGESQVYTIGKIGSFNVVSTKLAKMGEADGDIIAAENTVTRLLGIFNKVCHVFMVGVGGAVPHYSNYKEHVRLGDVVVSMPMDETEATYVYCSKVEKIRNSTGFSYMTRIFSPAEKVWLNAVTQMRKQVEANPNGPKPWDSHLELGKDILRGQEANFHRPLIKKDKLFRMLAEGKMIQVDHPRPNGYEARHFKEGQTQVRYGVVGCGQRVARVDPIRWDFAQMNGVKAFHQEHDIVLESVEGSGCESYIVILGMCDYADGTKNEWRSYAALAAAAYMKTLILSLSQPTSRNVSYSSSINGSRPLSTSYETAI